MFCFHKVRYYIFGKQPGAFHPVESSTLKHWRAVVIVRPKSADKFKPPVSRVVVD
jgi:hypothetical protein